MSTPRLPGDPASDCATRFPKLIDSIVLDELAGPAWQELRAHMVGCASCRARYDRVSLAERMLHGGPAALDTPSEPTMRRICAAVIDASAPAKRRFTLPRWAFGLASAAAAAGLAIAVLPHGGPGRAPEEPEFVARGAGRAAPLPAAASIRAFCASERGIRSMAAPASGEPATCATDELLKFSYENAAGYEDLFLVGVDERYAIKWYEPRPPSTLSVPAVRGGERPIPGAVKVGVNHQPGLLRVFGLFAHAPIAAREVEAAVLELQRGNAPLRGTSSLPIADRDDLAQTSILVEVSGPSGTAK